MADDDNAKPEGEEEDKAKEPDASEPLFGPAGEVKQDEGTRTEGLSFTSGLRELPNSKVPAMGDGSMVSHVFGPGQAPVDPVAAGLDTQFNPLTRNENRTITQTGTIAAGPRPSTYAEKPGHPIPQAAPADGANFAAPPDSEAAKAPGPNATGGDAPEILPKKTK